MTIWDLVMAEPKYLAIIGLSFDLIGGVLVALTAWFLALPFGRTLRQSTSSRASRLGSYSLFISASPRSFTSYTN